MAGSFLMAREKMKFIQKLFGFLRGWEDNEQRHWAGPEYPGNEIRPFGTDKSGNHDSALPSGQQFEETGDGVCVWGWGHKKSA